MIVVDTNLIVGMYTDAAQRNLAVAVYERDQAWSSSFLWRSAFRNVMALYLRKGLLELDQSIQITQWAEEQMSMHEYLPIAARVLKLAQESGCAAYDCEFVSVAIDLQCPLVTFDKKVLKQFPSIAVSPKEFVSR